MRSPLSTRRPARTVDFEVHDPRWDWSWREYPIDRAPETFDGFAPLVATWRRNGPAVPRWRDFDFADFRGWHGKINLLEVTRLDPIEFRVRLMGTTFVSLFGEDCTGARIAPGMGGFIEEDVHALTRLVDGPRIGRTAGPMDWRDREHILVDLLYLPVSSDGSRVDRLMECGRFPRMNT
jgi:hypothetical protein